MSELELKITVGGRANIGEIVRRMVTDGESNDGLVLATDSYTLDVVKLERADGLPLAIEVDFAEWVIKNYPAGAVTSAKSLTRPILPTYRQ